MIKLVGMLFLMRCVSSSVAAVTYQDSFTNNAGALHERSLDVGTSVWQNVSGNFQVTNGVLQTTSSGLAAAWLPLPLISSDAVVRVSAVVVGNGNANTDYISIGLSEVQSYTYSVGCPWLSLIRRVDNDLGYLRVHSGPGSSGTNFFNNGILAEAQGFTTDLNARNRVYYEYHTGNGTIRIGLISANGTDAELYNGSVSYNGIYGTQVPIDQLKYLNITFNSVNPQGMTNPAYVDDLVVEVIPPGSVKASETGRWTLQECSVIENSTLIQTMTNGASAQTWFSGSGLELYARTDSLSGYAQVYIDDRYVEQIKTYSASAVDGVMVFSINGLRRTDHKLKVVQQGNAGIKIDYIVADDSVNGLSAPAAQASVVSYDSPDITHFSGLMVFQTNNAPHIFHFRRSERDALTMSTNEWLPRYSNLMGVVGKMYNEDEIQLDGPNGDFPQREICKQFKAQNPEQLALLHYDGKYRNIETDNTTLYYAPQHFLYYVRQPGYSTLSAVSTQSVIQTASPVYKYFRLEGPTNAWGNSMKNEDVVLVKKAAGGGLDWSTYEYTTLVDYDNSNAFGDSILVDRGRYGSNARAWSANDYYLLVPVSSAPWDIEENNLWLYNFSTWCPEDSNGQTCADVFSDEMADKLLLTNDWALSEFDGVELDILPSDIQSTATANREIDSNCDGVADFGYNGETNLYGGGVYYLGQLLRQKLGNEKLILGDSSNTWQQRCFGLFNGMEQEGVIVGNDLQNDDHWTTALNRLRFWNTHAYAPALSYVNWKYVVDGIWYNLDQDIARLNLATLVAYDTDISFYSYKGLPVPTNIHDEVISGEDQIIGWLGAPLTASAACRATTGNDLLNGAGISVSSGFTNKIELLGEDLHMVRQGSGPYNLKIYSQNDGRVMFRIRDIDIAALDYPEFTCILDIASEKTGYLPDEMHRQFFVRVLDENFNVLKECNMFADNQTYMQQILYFCDLDSASTVSLEFEFEGCGYVRLRNTRIWDKEASFYREFENGFVAGNPSDHTVTIPLPVSPCFKLTAQPDTVRADYDQTVNDGSTVSSSVTLGPRDGIFLK